MKTKIAFIMDDWMSLNIQKDTSLYLIEGLQHNGCEVFHVSQDRLLVKENRLQAVGQLVPRFERKMPELGRETLLNLSDFQAIFVRKDPPFDRRYFYTTLLLDLLPNSVKVINKPQSLRDWNEKLSIFFFPQFIPESLVTNDPQEISNFLAQHNKIVVKPLDGFGGKGIEIFESMELSQVLRFENHIKNSRKVLVQKFVDEAQQGDKRVLLVNGNPVGAILRKNPEEGKLHNLDQGAEALPAELTDHEIQVCETMKPILLDRGLYFVGIDFLGPFLTEINVTSPTGLRQMGLFQGKNLSIEVAQALIASPGL